MAKRLKTRLSAGAALATGIGMMGIATASPAQAETEMRYECTVDDSTYEVDVTLETDAPEEATTGQELSITPSGTISLNDEAREALPDSWEAVEGSIPDVNAIISNGTESATVTTDLTIPSTPIHESGTPGLAIKGAAQTASVAEPGEYSISAPDTFTATLTGTNNTGITITSTCNYVEDSGSQVIDTMTVTDDGNGEEPTEDDWFNEPSSLPLADNVFTVEGTATRAGTLSIEVLGEATDDAGEPVPGEVLETHTWKVTEGSNTKDFDLNEGAGYVRIVSQDCVDANGDDETVEGSGCNVLYTASWVDGGDNGDGEPVDDGEPEVPEVVQTDGVEATTPTEDSTLAFALGGLLLAAAGTGTVLVARRRAAARH